jgi:hypothetical protein
MRGIREDAIQGVADVKSLAIPLPPRRRVRDKGG